MLKRLLFSLALVTVIAAPALATDLGPTTRSDIGSDPGTLNTLQPATPTTLQSGTPQGSLNGTTSGAQLQPAGTRSDLPASFSSDISGSPQVSATPASNRANQIILGLIGTFIAICAFFMFRISKQLESKAEAGPASTASHDEVIEPENLEQEQEDKTPEGENSPETPISSTITEAGDRPNESFADQPVESEAEVADDSLPTADSSGKSSKKARKSRNHR